MPPQSKAGKNKMPTVERVSTAGTSVGMSVPPAAAEEGSSWFGATAQLQETDAGDTIVKEGKEDVAYIYLDLSELDSSIPLAGTTVHIQGLESEKPEIRLQDGTLMEGQYVDTAGSTLFFEGDCEARHTEDDGVETQLRYMGLSEHVIRFYNKPASASAMVVDTEKSTVATPKKASDD